MIYRIFSPSPALSDIIEHYWYSETTLAGSMTQSFPTPLLQALVFNFNKHVEHHKYHNQAVSLYKQAYIFGQPTCPRIINTDDKGIEILGVKFKPLGIVKLTGINMEHIADYIISAEDIWGAHFNSLCDEMQSANSIEGAIITLEHFLLKKYKQVRLHYRVEYAHHALSIIDRTNGTISINELQNLSNTSRKTLERTFLHYLGLNPKLYSQIIRFNTAKSLINNLNSIDISDLGHELDYYDHSHFSAEFKRFSNFTPREYIKNINPTHPIKQGVPSKRSLRFLESIFLESDLHS